jgi:hypothetical protein
LTELTMSRLPVALLVGAALVTVAAACYKDDSTGTVNHGKPMAKVLLTDAPFPYDSVAGVNVYVVRIEASTGADTTGGGDWVVITEPRKAFNLLDFQQGGTAFVGQGELTAGQYHAIRMTIDTSLSSIVWNNGSKAAVNWQNWSGSNEEPLYAIVEYPVNVPSDGAEIVIDFDVGRSFLYNFRGTNEFILAPQLRAINSAATGAIAGTVTSDYSGQTRPIANANVTVCGGSSSCAPPYAYVVATGRTDAAGHYKVAFLRAGAYTVRFEQPDYPFLAPVTTSDVGVTVGQTTTASASLPKAGSGGAYIHISGPSSVGVGGRIYLYAAVGDANGNPNYSARVTWTSSDTTVAAFVNSNDSIAAVVEGRQSGVATIYASSGGLTDTHAVQVVALGPVATVTVLPDSATVTLGDSGVSLQAVLRDSAGNVLNRGASWYTPDSLVLDVPPCGDCGGELVRGRASGVGTVFATRDGRTGRATIKVH